MAEYSFNSTNFFLAVSDMSYNVKTIRRNNLNGASIINFQERIKTSPEAKGYTNQLHRNCVSHGLYSPFL